MSAEKEMLPCLQNDYSRQNPSPEYLRLSALYRELHSSGHIDNKGTDIYPGRSLWPHIGFIKALIERYGIKSILDYGAGKGKQYTNLWVKPAKGKIYSSVEEYWQAKVICYDAGNSAFNTWPEGSFDAVISTDVLEHCSREDLGWIIGEMFEKAEKLVFANIACYPAKAILPNGENAHATIEKPAWWEELIIAVASNYPGVDFFFLTEEKKNQKPVIITNAEVPKNVPKVGALPASIWKAGSLLLKQKLSTFLEKTKK